MTIFDKDIPPLGMGCWPIGGEMFSGDKSLGYSRTDDATSIRTLEAAFDHGIRLFDTAAAYGAGHSERLLAQAFGNREDIAVVTKVGIHIDETTRQLSFDRFDHTMVDQAVHACLGRLKRDRIDCVLLHSNQMPVPEATPIFEEMDRLVSAGKIASYGWSTDISQSAAALAPQPHFRAVEYAMNLFFSAQPMQKVAKEGDLVSLIRSPLAMGLLGGNYDQTTVLPTGDIRASTETAADYFHDGRANAALMAKLDGVRALLTTGGRSLVQGALGWIWAQDETLVPVPGARTPQQIEGIAGALAFGPLPADTMAEIERLFERDETGPDIPR